MKNYVHIWLIPMLLMTLASSAKTVRVVQRLNVGETVETLSDELVSSDVDSRSQTAPTRDGYVFTGWTASPAAGVKVRDASGRALKEARFNPTCDLTLTASYIAESVDDDADGIPDGLELFWYGDLSKDAASDTDGDGFTFAQEIAAGTSPLMKDHSLGGGVAWRDSGVAEYNPHGYRVLTIRSEPEGVLFETTVETYVPGTVVTSPTVAFDGTRFAYWKLDGVRQADTFGKAKRTVNVTMASVDADLVAVCVDDETERQKLYWYGDASVSLTSDTDGDGFTFAQEIAAGTSPLLKNRSLGGGVAWRDSNVAEYNPHSYRTLTIRSEPEGALFETTKTTYAPGDTIVSPTVDATGTDFAYWRLNGVRQADAFGKAKRTVTVTMPSVDSELVAVCETDETVRQKLYWYGNTSVALTSDTDGDGFTFAQEIAAGTNPLMKNRSLGGGVAWRDSGVVIVNLTVTTFTIRFVSGGNESVLYCDPGKVYNLPACMFAVPSGKSRFAGWRGSDGRRYDDRVLVFDLAPVGSTLTLTAIWE